MKKLYILFAVIIAVVMVMPVAAHDKVTYAAWGTPTIDAVKEAVWDNAQYIEVKDEAYGDASALGEQSTAVVYSLWDGDYIYFYAIVTDPTVDAVLRDDAWNQDAMGFMLDFGYVREPEVSFRDLGEDSYAGYVNVPAVEGDKNYPEGPTIFGQPGYAENTKSYCRITDKGYEIEIAIPLLYKDYKPGDKIGFEIFLNNAIGDGSRYGFSVWCNDEDGSGADSWQYSYNMGTLIFQEKPAEPEPVVDETPVTTTTETPVVSAPRTFDFVAFSTALAAISLAGYVATKKDKC